MRSRIEQIRKEHHPNAWTVQAYKNPRIIRDHRHIEFLLKEVDRLEGVLRRINHGDTCDECKADRYHIRLYDAEGFHSCRAAIAKSGSTS